LVVLASGWAPDDAPLRRVWRLLALGAAGVAVTQGLSLGVVVGALGTESDWHTRELAATGFVRASALRMLASGGLVLGALALRRPAQARIRWALLLACALGLVVAGAWTSHAAARAGHRATLMALDELTQLAAAVRLAGLLALGAANFVAVRRLADGHAVSQPRVRRFVEVELGLGITVLFAAASLTSLPPAIDVVADRATPDEVVTRFTPRWPSFTSPPIEQLPVDDKNAPRT